MRPAGSGRGRQVRALLVLGVSLVALLATTKAPDPTLVAELAGPPVSIAADVPEVTASFTITVSDAVLDNPGDLFVSVHATPVFVGAEGVLDGLWVPVELVSEPENGPDEEDACVEGACGGTYEATFAWPDRLPAGRARVEWVVSARMTWDGDGVPEGAAMEIEHGPLLDDEVGDTPVVWQRGDIELSHEVPVVQHVVAVTTTQPMGPDDQFGIELIDEHGGELAFRSSDGTSAAVLPRSFSPVVVPPECWDGPCAFDVEVFASLPSDDRPALNGRLTWALSVVGDVAGRVSVTDVEPWSATSELALPSATLARPDDGATHEVEVRVPADLVGSRVTTVALHLRAIGPPLPGDHLLTVEVLSYGQAPQPGMPWPRRDTASRELTRVGSGLLRLGPDHVLDIVSDEVAAILVEDCEPGRECVLPFRIEMEARRDAWVDQGEVAVELEVTVTPLDPPVLVDEDVVPELEVVR